MKSIFYAAILGIVPAISGAVDVSVCAVSHTGATLSAVADSADANLEISLKNGATGETKTLSKNSSDARISTHANVVKIALGGLAPDTEYAFEVRDLCAKKSASGAFKTKADFEGRTPPPDFSFAVLGANYINDKPFDPPFRTNGGEYEIFDAAANSKCDFAFFADGLDTLRNADLDSLSAVFSRFAKARSFAPARKFFANTPSYGVVAAAAFGVGNPDKFAASAQYAGAAFDVFWGNPQPVENARYYKFGFSDAEFFVLDTCSERSNLDYKEHMPQILGERQLTWLMASLAQSKATFKIIVLNTPLTNPVKSASNMTFAERERKALLDFLVLKKISGVVVFSANKRYFETTRFIRAGAYPLYEITVGAFTNRPAGENEVEMNYFRVPNSLSTKRGFAVVKIDGAEGDRTLSVSILNARSEPVSTLKLKQSDLEGDR